MLRIGKLTDYALLILSAMAQQPLQRASASYLADKLRLNLPTVSKILKMLNEGKLVTSQRGADGGYVLAKPAKTITLNAVIAVMEGRLAMTECCEKISHCQIDAHCQLQTNWRKINKLIENLLTEYTIEDFCI